MRSENKPVISREEWRPVILAACGIMLLTLIPYLPGLLLSQPPYRFVGIIYNVEDYRTYLAKMWLGYRGDWLYTSTFTAQEHPAAFVYSFYILLGHVARWLGLSLPLTYQLARLVSGVALLLMVYRFAAAFLPRPIRWYTFLLTATGSGLSWLSMFLPSLGWLGDNRPIDMWVPEGNVFFSLTIFPHFILAYLCIIGFFLNILPILENDSSQPVRGAVIRATLFGAALGFIHPYMVLPLGLISGFYLLWQTIKARRFTWRPWLLLGGIGLVLLPVAGYSLAVFVVIPHYREWLARGVMLSPTFSRYLLGYGFLWVLAAWGAWRLRSHPRLPFLLIWVAVTFILVYIPHNVQRRFIEGVPIALGILAGAGLMMGVIPWLSRQVSSLKQRYPERVAGWRWLTIVCLILFVSLSNFFVFVSFALATTVHDSFYYYRDDDAAAMEWLLAEEAWAEPVASAEETGNLLGGQIGQKVVLGHWAESFDYDTISQQMGQFFDESSSDDQRQRWLAEWGASYLYYGRHERALGEFDPDQADYLESVFQQGEVTLYQVIR
jgi:hypothetical protein